MPQEPRGWGVGEGVCPSSLGKGLERELCPSPENLSYFLLKIPYFDAF